MWPLSLSACSVVTALGAGVAPLRRALHDRQGGLRRCDFRDAPEDVWIGRVPGVEEVALPPALAGLLLLVVGATYEQRLRDARRLKDALGRMR